MTSEPALTFIREEARAERCVTCGSPVEVVTSDEGTHYYRPASTRVREDDEARVGWEPLSIREARRKIAEWEAREPAPTTLKGEDDG